jgi:hypothetical protein
MCRAVLLVISFSHHSISIRKLINLNQCMPTQTKRRRHVDVTSSLIDFTDCSLFGPRQVRSNRLAMADPICQKTTNGNHSSSAIVCTARIFWCVRFGIQDTFLSLNFIRFVEFRPEICTRGWFGTWTCADSILFSCSLIAPKMILKRQNRSA